MSNQLVRQMIYDLKRAFGVRMELYSLTGGTVDLATGAKTVVKSKYVIGRAVLLPTNLYRMAAQLLGEHRQFKYGGALEQSRRIVLVDSGDLPSNFQASPGDWVVVDHARYNLKTVEFFDGAAMLVVENTEGEQPAAIVERSIKNRLFLSHAAEVVP